MIHLLVEWLSFSPIEWLYISFCSLCLGILLGYYISTYLLRWHIRQIQKEDKDESQT